MIRHAVPLAMILLALLAAGCTGTRSSQDQSAEDPSDSPAPAAEDSAEVAAEEVGGAAEPAEIVDPVAAALAGEHVPSQVSIMVLPGLGYRIGEKHYDLPTVDRFLAIVAHHNRYADIRLRTARSGRATLLAPILSVCERHELINVSLWDGL